MSDRGQSGIDGADRAELDLPDRRPWADAFRSSGVVWWLAFLAINYVALGLAMGVHGAGFDDCEVAPTSSDRALMARIAVAAVAGSAVLAIWRARGSALLIALGAVALSGFAWWILLSDSQAC